METISLLVGFSAGQVQYLDLIKKDTSKLFNEEVIVGPWGPEPRPPPSTPTLFAMRLQPWGVV